MKNIVSYIIMSALLTMAAVSCKCSGNAVDGDGSADLTTKADSTLAADSLVAADNAKTDSTMTFNPAELPEEPMFDIVTNLGTIRVKLYSGTPKHRANFIKLAKENFFDGIIFHRVINGFMIQGGDPLTKDPSNADLYGTGGPGYTVPAEFVPEYRHKKGALAAARKGDMANPKKASSGSQFYLVQDEYACSQLDGQYTVFGETVEGLDVIDKIAAVPTDRRDRPMTDVVILSVKPVL